MEDEEPLHGMRPLLHPSRWPVVAGTAALVVGTFMPWQTIRYPVGAPTTITGASTTEAPGLQMLLLAALSLLACALPAVAGSRTRTVQLLPAIAGCVPLILALEEYQRLAPSSSNPGAPTDVTLEGGFWLALVASALIALGGLAATILVVRERPLKPEPWEPKADLSMVRPLVAMVAGLVVSLGLTEAVAPELVSGLNGTPIVVAVWFASALVLNSLLARLDPSARRAREAARRRSVAGSLSHPDMPDLEPVRRRD